MPDNFQGLRDGVQPLAARSGYVRHCLLQPLMAVLQAGDMTTGIKEGFGAAPGPKFKNMPN
jgi:hypothetical protein